MRTEPLRPGPSQLRSYTTTPRLKVRDPNKPPIPWQELAEKAGLRVICGKVHHCVRTD